MSDAFRSQRVASRSSVAPDLERSGSARHDIPASTPLDEARSKARLEVERLRDEVALLKERLAAIPLRTRGMIATKGVWINASARAQLGKHPWAKLAAAFLASYVFGKVIQKVPFGLVAAVLVGRGRHLR
ncbi:hypothetical protein AB4Z52_03120 [Rhizobium sp. 2YAF20]|uniref:hypothetical protein n=1 Tax=Rhizobium sp. 2YAF20 TaxID=3233027 RepID=UPI003F98FB47